MTNGLKECSKKVLNLLRCHFSWNKERGLVPKVVVPKTGWFMMQYPITMDVLGVPPFLGNLHLNVDTLPH